MNVAVVTLMTLLLCAEINAQERNIATDRVRIEGKVKSTVEITIKDLVAMPSKHIDSCVIQNHLQQKKYTLINIEGIPIKEILLKATITADHPKQLSEYYFVFIAADNYKVVYSWNELFNSSTGDNVFIVKARNGENLTKQNDAISVLCTSDSATGRRYVKGLKQILVERVN